jgi:hypothetical protein
MFRRNVLPQFSWSKNKASKKPARSRQNLLFDPENGDNALLPDVDELQPDYTALKPRRLYSLVTVRGLLIQHMGVCLKLDLYHKLNYPLLIRDRVYRHHVLL